MNASSQDVLQHLIKADTASAFNISVGDVNVTGISQVCCLLTFACLIPPPDCFAEPQGESAGEKNVCAMLISSACLLLSSPLYKAWGFECVQVSRRVLYVNVTATLGVNVPPNASPDDVRSALDMTNLSADDPIAMLAANPDRFFGRTTKVCAVSCNHRCVTRIDACRALHQCTAYMSLYLPEHGLARWWVSIMQAFSVCVARESAVQALDVTAETDGRAPQRTEYRPFGSGSALGRAWPAIGAVLLLAVIAGCCLAWHWRRRSKRLQRICDAVLERCRRCRQGRGRWHTTVRLLSCCRPQHSKIAFTLLHSALVSQCKACGCANWSIREELMLLPMESLKRITSDTAGVHHQCWRCPQCDSKQPRAGRAVKSGISHQNAGRRTHVQGHHILRWPISEPVAAQQCPLLGLLTLSMSTRAG